MRVQFTTLSTFIGSEIELFVTAHGEIEPADESVGIMTPQLVDFEIESIQIGNGRGHNVTAAYAEDPGIIDEAKDAIWDAWNDARDDRREAAIDHHLEIHKNRGL